MSPALSKERVEAVARIEAAFKRWRERPYPADPWDRANQAGDAVAALFGRLEGVIGCEWIEPGPSRIADAVEKAIEFALNGR